MNDQIFPHMAVKDKIICSPFSAFYGNIFLVRTCTSSDQQSVMCVCVCVCMAAPSSSAEA